LNVFDGNIDKRELVSELYLFMANNDWAVFRKFQYRSSLMTYVSVVAVRFFQKKRLALTDSMPFEELNEKLKHEYNTGFTIEQRMDIRAALQKMPNTRYRQIIEVLDLQDLQPEIVAKEMNVTVDNLYNIHRRALVQLRLIMGRKEEYV
jgi:DNA-directed RNA polymerase specialized sigma24 family protein